MKMGSLSTRTPDSCAFCSLSVSAVWNCRRPIFRIDLRGRMESAVDIRVRGASFPVVNIHRVQQILEGKETIKPLLTMEADQSFHSFVLDHGIVQRNGGAPGQLVGTDLSLARPRRSALGVGDRTRLEFGRRGWLWLEEPPGFIHLFLQFSGPSLLLDAD